MAVQIDKDLWDALVQYHLADDLDEYEEQELLAFIQKGLIAKIDKILDREYYSAYKRAPEGAEREKYRQAYLDRRGIPSGFRTATEEPYKEPPAE